MNARARTKADKEPFARINGFYLNAIGDTPDHRDYDYQPALIQLTPSVDPPVNPVVLDQGREGACTGFGLAAVINLLLERRGEQRQVSPRMLYEMARKFDEWEGEDYVGSSCRGAIRGWHSMGVCSEDKAPYRASESDWCLNIEQAFDARKTTLGAYYRVDKRLSDYHAAINEVGALFCSANVHKGWYRGQVKDGVIPFKGEGLGGHAFAIVGYNQDGFWVLNSWGEDWGARGIALWTYEDWLENVRDAWVFRLAVSTPQVWHLSPRVGETPGTEEGLTRKSPKRAEILGHFVHIDDGHFDDKGKYWTDLSTVTQTAERLAGSDWYEHLLLYAHGGLNSIEASARRIAAMKDVFMDNRIYPFHFMYDTGLLEEIKDLVLGRQRDLQERAGGFSDFTDRLLERALRTPGRAIWREMKRGARRPFHENQAGVQTLNAFMEAFAKDGARPKKIHVVGHSTGAILLASLLRHLGKLQDGPRIQTCCLLAPACTHDEFNEVYRPLMKERNRDRFGIHRMAVYNLDDDLERDDTVTPVYRKSLLYLVSRSFEEERGERILGMHAVRNRLGRLPDSPTFNYYLSDGKAESDARTASRTHGGFDNDALTMNDVLRMVLRGRVERSFTPDDLDY